MKAYLTGSCSSLLPPYVALKRIWERKPGNKYEDHMSGEQVCAHGVIINSFAHVTRSLMLLVDSCVQELCQDYQFLHPESEYEVAVKLGPIPNEKDAKIIVAEWKRTAKQLFDAREYVRGRHVVYKITRTRYTD